MEQKQTHGGARKGAGRKTFAEKTKTIRFTIPISAEKHIKQIVKEALKNEKMK